MAANFCLHLSDSKFLEIICLDIVPVQRHDFPFLAVAPYGRCFSLLAEVLLLPFCSLLHFQWCCCGFQQLLNYFHCLSPDAVECHLLFFGGGSENIL